jgi:hypothetical protein
MKDLIVLVADKNMEFTVKGILQRNESVNIRGISYKIMRHSQNDPGVYRAAHDFLRIYVNEYRYAIVMLDREGCGCADNSVDIGRQIQSRLDNSGWNERSAVIILDPELEIWVWSDSPEVANCIGWSHNELRGWLHSHGDLSSDTYKPRNPKIILENVLKIKNIPRSSSIYYKLATRVSFNRCTDSAFLKFKNTLQHWFSADSQ